MSKGIKLLVSSVALQKCVAKMIQYPSKWLAFDGSRRYMWQSNNAQPDTIITYNSLLIDALGESGKEWLLLPFQLAKLQHLHRLLRDIPEQPVLLTLETHDNVNLKIEMAHTYVID